MDGVMDLSLRNSSCLSSSSSSVSLQQPATQSNQVATIVRPIPRPPWSIVWYQNLWSLTTTTPSSFPTTLGETLEGGEVKNEQIFDCSRETSETTETTNNYTQLPFLPRSQHNHHHWQLQQLKVSGLSAETCPYDEDTGGEMRRSQLPSYYKVSQIQYPNKNFSTSPKSDCENNNENNEPCSSDDDEEGEVDGATHIVVTSSSTTAESISSCSSNMNDDNIQCNSSSALSLGKADLRGNLGPIHSQDATTSVVLDIACCDGPVQFKRVSNPNFALTVEHNDAGASSSMDATKGVRTEPPEYSNQPKPTTSTDTTCTTLESSSTSNLSLTKSYTSASTTTTTSLKTYLCIYCNQSFKSLFCYQKHKKRHLNPVSVDITTTTTMSKLMPPRTSSHHQSNKKGGTNGGGAGTSAVTTSGGGSISESTKAKMKDLNVQFFPCKKCGCKFPSYYFVHKHRKICH